jgi:hypothetical protein
MSPQLHALTHGTNGLVLAYASVQVPLLVGLLQGRAPVDKVLRSPLLAIPLTLLGLRGGSLDSGTRAIVGHLV